MISSDMDTVTESRMAIAMARSEKIIRRALKKDSEKSKDDDVIDI